MRRNGVGCLVLMLAVTLIFVLAQPRGRTIMPTLAVLPTITVIPPVTSFTDTPTSAPSATPVPTETDVPLTGDRARFATAAAFIAPLDGDLQALNGVVESRSALIGKVVDVQARVQPGYNSQATANAMLRLASERVPELSEFFVILDDGGVPVDYHWQSWDDEWTSTPLVAQATFFATFTATFTPSQTFTPSRTVIPTAQSFPTLPPAQASTVVRPQAAPTRVMGSPFACNGVDDLNCSDFGYDPALAQAHLDKCGNEDRLDGDSDGYACEPTNWGN